MPTRVEKGKGVSSAKAERIKHVARRIGPGSHGEPSRRKAMLDCETSHYGGDWCTKKKKGL